MRVGMLAALVAVLSACGDNAEGEDHQGGATTIDDRTQTAFSHSAPNLRADELVLAAAGKDLFDFNWQVPLLGPLFNNDACVGCHGSNGRGLSQIGNDGHVGGNGPVSQALVRVSLLSGPGALPGGDVPVPGYGLQLQDHATSGPPEVVINLQWNEDVVGYGDGELEPVRTPQLDIRTPTGDPLLPGVLTSYRIAQPLLGLGLLSAIPEDTLHALEDPDDANGDGISGRLDYVWSEATHGTKVGRLGWKANVTTLDVQVAGAFANDMGLTNHLFLAPDGSRELSDNQIDATLFYVATIAVPIAAPRNAAARSGRILFDRFGCSGCHVPTLVTGDAPSAALAHQTIHPYTDLLLHDMGDGLADRRPDWLATGSEWRTPPLWGIGLTQVVQVGATFLHDGRARTLAEAILWHGGEAMAAREAFRTARKDDRDALLAFLQTL